MTRKLLWMGTYLVAGTVGLTALVLGEVQGASAWGPAVPEVDVNLNTAGEGCPIETPDGLSLLFASNREEPGGNDIWVANRDTVGSAWTPPQKLAAANSASADFCPTPIDRYLFFVSTRRDGTPCGPSGGDIHVMRQSPTGDWTDPTRLGCAPDGPNTAGAEFSPSLVAAADGTYLFFSSDGSGGQDIYMSTLGPNGFEPGVLVDRLSTAGWDDRMPNVRALERGGFEVVFSSDRPTSGPGHRFAAFGSQDVYTSTIMSSLRTGNWSDPVNLGPNVNTTGSETRASLSADGQRLHFGRDGDIFVSPRQ